MLRSFFFKKICGGSVRNVEDIALQAGTVLLKRPGRRAAGYLPLQIKLRVAARIAHEQPRPVQVDRSTGVIGTVRAVALEG